MQHPSEQIQYECAICLDEFTLDGGAVTCSVHFFCEGCLVENFRLAVDDPLSTVFPVQCCSKADGSRRPATVLRRRLQHLLPPDVNSAYARKEVEYYTPPALKLYCVECRIFLPPESFQDKGPHTLAECDCGTKMCVGCKGTWNENHRCIDARDPLARPDWLPEYTDEFRVKKCPGCKMYIEHQTACNHMTCWYCRHEFCFVCLLPWMPDMAHEEAGCPMWGEPACGYDKEGYEKSERRLHRDTGLTRDGLDRKGDTPVIGNIAEANIDAGNMIDAWGGDLDDNENGGWDNWDDGNENDGREDNDEDHHPWWIHNRNPEEDRNPENDGSVIHVDPEELADQEYRAELERTFPGTYFPHNFPGEIEFLNFNQIECPHAWKYNNTYNSDHGEVCAVCNFFMDYYHFECTICEVIACAFCHMSWRHRLEYYNPAAENMVTVLQFAENGEVPFKTRRRAFWTAIQEADAVPVWSVPVMFKEYDKMVLELDPFYYGELGIFEMFEEAEKELSYHDWYVRVEDVGLPGNAMTFNMHNNRFAPLFWSDRD